MNEFWVIALKLLLWDEIQSDHVSQCTDVLLLPLVNDAPASDWLEIQDMDEVQTAALSRPYKTIKLASSCLIKQSDRTGF